LDFNTFVIAGPSTLTASNFKVLAGSLSTTTGVAASLATECLTDTFSVTGSGGTAPPVICGTNGGYHSKKKHFFTKVFQVLKAVISPCSYIFINYKL
jgi:hypothetical protein